MIKDIVPTTDPTLRKKSKPVKKLDKKILNIIKDMKDTLLAQKDPEGVGLAAPQIGKNVKIFIMKPNKNSKIKTVINPEILSLSEKPKKKKKDPKVMEGCLSLPMYYGPLVRPKKIKIKYQYPKQTKDGNWKMLPKEEVFKKFPAQVVQHEIDHLNGILFIDRLLESKRKLYKMNKKENVWEEVELV